METNKDKLIKFWKETCKTTSDRLDAKFTYYKDIPEEIKKQIDNYIYFDKLSDEEKWSKLNSINTEKYKLKINFNNFNTDYNKFLYFTFNENPPISITNLNLKYSGSVKVNSTEKEIIEKLFKWSKPKSRFKIEYNLCDIDLNRKKEFFGTLDDFDIRWQTKKGYFNKTYKCAYLQFGNIKAIVSPEEKEELFKCYFDAIKRVDVEILDKRIKEIES